MLIEYGLRRLETADPRPGHLTSAASVVCHSPSADLGAALATFRDALAAATSGEAGLKGEGGLAAGRSGAELQRLLLDLIEVGDLLDAATAPVADAWERDGYWQLNGSRSPVHRLARETKHSLSSCRVDAERGADGSGPEPNRFVRLTTTFHGAVSVDGVLDPVGGAIVNETLRLIQKELELTDRKAGSLRTAAERSADALVEMATRARDARAGRRSRPLITVITGNESLARLCELDTGAVVRPADLLRYLPHSMVQVFQFGPDGQPVSASRARTYRGMLRRAIQVRDRHCQHESGCNQPLVACDVDHRTPYAHGGRTTLDQGRLLCTAHNRLPQLRDPIGLDPPKPHRRQ